MKDQNILHVVESGGDSLIRRNPVFSLDSRLLFCACGNDIKLFSTTSGECMQNLMGHTDRVTGIALHPCIKLQILSCSLDGSLREWDFEDGILLRTCIVGFPLHCLYMHEKYSEHAYVIVEKESDYLLSRVLMKNLQSRRNEIALQSPVEKEILVNEIKRPFTKSVKFMSSGKHVVCCRKQSLAIINIKHPENKPTEYFFDEDGKITSLTCHPTDNCFVTGHTSGKIKFWHNVCSLKPKKKNKAAESCVVTSTQHWHKEAVEDVCFTPGGSTVLSVGKEAVLVQWQYLESGNKRNFFPRLGAPIRHIAVSNDGTLYATTHLDNSILIITNYFTIRQTLEGFTSSRHLKYSEPKEEIGSSLLPCGLVYDWKTRTCVTNGKPGHLLFYEPFTNKQMYNLDIVHQNYIVSDMSSGTIETVVTHVAFPPECATKANRDNHISQSWMATIEERDDGFTSRHQKLNIWEFNETEQWWKLNTVVNDPHNSSVTRLVFRPHSDVGVIHPALLSTGLDGMAKIWTLVTESKEKASSFWSCEAVASYRQLPVLDGDFSQDGSLAALAFGHTLCLSDPEMLEDLTVFFPLPKPAKIRRVLFGHYSCQHVLLAHTDDNLHACDLLSGSLMWSADVHISHLIRDPLSEYLAAFTTDQNLHVFQPTRALPIYTHSNVCKRKVISAGFIPNSERGKKSWMKSNSDVMWLKKSRIFFISEKMSVHTLCTSDELDQRKSLSEATGKSVPDMDKLYTPLASILSKSNSMAEKEDTGEELNPTTLTHNAFMNALKKVTETPSHVMPPISTLCQSFISSLLLGNTSNKKLRNGEGRDTIMMDTDDDAAGMKPITTRTNNTSDVLNKITADSFIWAADGFNT